MENEAGTVSIHLLQGLQKSVNLVEFGRHKELWNEKITKNIVNE